MKKLNNILIYIILILSVCVAIYDFNNNESGRILCDLGIIPVLFIPKIFNKISKFKIGSFMEFVILLFIFLAYFLGIVTKFYNTIWWYDIFAHTISGILTGIFALVILYWFGKYDKKSIWFNVLFIISFSLSIAVIWEFLEFFWDVLFNLNVQHSLDTGVRDTMEDMLVAFLGSVIVGITYLLEGKNGFIKKVVSDIK